MKTNSILWRKINYFLYKKNVKIKKLRNILILQIFTFLGFFLVGIGFFKLATWIFWISIGLLLATINFFSLTKIVPRFIVNQYNTSSNILLVLRSQFRLAISAVIICLLHVYLDAQVWALLLGFGLGLSSIIIIVYKKL